MDQSSDPFGVIDPQGNFSDFIIAPGSITWNTTDAEITVVPQAIMKWVEAPDFLWEGTFILKEV